MNLPPPPPPSLCRPFPLPPPLTHPVSQLVYRAEPAEYQYSLDHLEAWLLSPANAHAESHPDPTAEEAAATA